MKRVKGPTPPSHRRSFTYRELRIALDESIKLQAHYAKSLNMIDGGERIIFKSKDDWISRLYDVKCFD